MFVWIFFHSLFSGPEREEDKHFCYLEVDKKIRIFPLCLYLGFNGL